jgi:co-chaperonin GroES (HSP10)
MIMIMKNIAKNIIKKNTENINENEVELVPCNTGVLIKFYEDNPYRKVEKTESGLIIGIESAKKYKSCETGEIEENDEYVACAKVIAVGPKCENVHVGDDIFLIKHIALPVPFRKQGYYTISEQNILCWIK